MAKIEWQRCVAKENWWQRWNGKGAWQRKIGGKGGMAKVRGKGKLVAKVPCYPFYIYMVPLHLCHQFSVAAN